MYGKCAFEELDKALAAWSSGIVTTCHRGDWSYWSWDRIPPGYNVVVLNRKAAHFMSV
jgi:hypothetical protein